MPNVLPLAFTSVDEINDAINNSAPALPDESQGQRNWQISPLLSDIAKGYKGKSEKTTRQLRWLLGVTSVLALALLAAFFYVRSRNRQLRVARNALSSKNRELSELNVQLSEANQQQPTVGVEPREGGVYRPFPATVLDVYRPDGLAAQAGEQTDEEPSV